MRSSALSHTQPPKWERYVLLLFIALIEIGCSAEDRIDSPTVVAATTEVTVTIPFTDSASSMTRLELSIIDSGSYLLQDKRVTENINSGWVSTIPDIRYGIPLDFVSNGYDATDTLIATGTTQIYVDRNAPNITIHLHPPASIRPNPQAIDWLSFDGSNNQQLTNSYMWRDGHSAALELDNDRGLFFWTDSINGQTKAQVLQLSSVSRLSLGNVFAFSTPLFSDSSYNWRGVAQLDNNTVVFAGSGAGFGTSHNEHPTLKIVKRTSSLHKADTSDTIQVKQRD